VGAILVLHSSRVVARLRKKFVHVLGTRAETAKSPADFRIDIHSPAQLASDQGAIPTADPRSIRRAFARIRAVSTGVLTPWSGVNVSAIPGDVSFNVILEPLLFGVLPRSLVPTILFLLSALAIAACAAPIIHRYIRAEAETARDELSAARKAS
jgi:hypothetical protein